MLERSLAIAERSARGSYGPALLLQDLAKIESSSGDYDRSLDHLSASLAAIFERLCGPERRGSGRLEQDLAYTSELKRDAVRSASRASESR